MRIRLIKEQVAEIIEDVVSVEWLFSGAVPIYRICGIGGLCQDCVRKDGEISCGAYYPAYNEPGQSRGLLVTTFDGNVFDEHFFSGDIVEYEKLNDLQTSRSDVDVPKG